MCSLVPVGHGAGSPAEGTVYEPGKYVAGGGWLADPPPVGISGLYAGTGSPALPMGISLPPPGEVDDALVLVPRALLCLVAQQRQNTTTAITVPQMHRRMRIAPTTAPTITEVLPPALSPSAVEAMLTPI